LHQDGSKESFEVAHSYNSQQIEWFKAGGALNVIRRNIAK
jgi:aconitate hydratase